MPIVYPTDQQHLSIIGRNGSGKTVAALHHLSLRDYVRKPWVVYDYKGDENIDQLLNLGAERITLDEVPVQPGIWIVKPDTDDNENGRIAAHMKAIWERENTGVYIDEGYMVGLYNTKFRNILVQGRSKHIPVIVLTQRPVYVDRFVFTESSFFQIFDLQHDDDLKTLLKFIKIKDVTVKEKFIAAFDGTGIELPEFHSYYYDVKRRLLTPLQPVPSVENILDIFARRLKARRRSI